MPKKSLKYIVLLILLGCFVSANLIMAADHLINPKDDCIKTGNCSITDINYTIIRVSEIILGVVGSLALLAFVVGGFMLLVSGGNKNWIDRGKATLIGAVIGLAIVFLSYTIISFVFTSMGIDKGWFKSNWF